MTTQKRKTVKRTKPRSKRKINKLHLWTFLLGFLVVCELIVGMVGAGMLYSMAKDKPQLNIDDFFSPESSHIYDRNGTLIADVGVQLRENITYDEISESLIDAFLAVEDSRFYGHNGFDVPRFLKAIIENAKAVLTRSSARQGGSTFTMQLVKLTYWQNDDTGVTRSKDIEYKVQQIILAQELEEKSNKKAIFEMYLNKMNFGGTGNIRGVEKAAQYYYGKHASELNLPEAAMLAGVINSPYYYDPHNFLDYATSRRNTVLKLMQDHGYITKKEYEIARNVKVEDTLVNPFHRSSSGGNKFAYQSYIDTVISEAERITGQDPLYVAMDIYTYMDPNVQKVMDDIQSDSHPDVVFPDDLMEVGIISENNQTGEIVAIGGGRNYGRGGSMLLNHATQQYKQPGSSVKPIIDYALAFEYLGWATSHVVTDRPIMYEGTNTVIKNASGYYGGQMTLQYAVSMSLNTPAIQALQDVINVAGWQTTVDYIKSLGFSQVTDENFDIGFAIGGSNFTCTPKELMAAHAVLMNGGYYIEPHTISKVVFRNGLTSPVEPTYEPVQVLSPQAAYLAATLMRNVVPQYIFTQLLQRDYPVYAKTGTTDWGSEGLQYNIPQGASKDKWMVSETSQYTTAVWVGYEKGEKDMNTYFNDEKQNMNIQGRISNVVLSALNDELHPPEVPRPEGISDITHILGTFPYAYTLPDMNGQYITTGMVKSEFGNLVDPQMADDIAPLQSFTASYQDGGVQVDFGVYPDASKLEVAPDTMDISLYNGDQLVVEAWGKRLFDYSWIFGAIRYKTYIRQDGQVKATFMSDQPSHYEAVELDPGKQTEACGVYVYEWKEEKTSNEVCVSFTTPEDESKKEDARQENSDGTVRVPTLDAGVDELIAWCLIHNVRYEIHPRSDVTSFDTSNHTNVIFYREGDASVVNSRSDLPEADLDDLICWIYE